MIFWEVLQEGCSSCALFCFAHVLWVLPHTGPDEVPRQRLITAAGDDHFSDGVQAAAMAAGVHFGDDDLLFDAKAAVQASHAGQCQAVNQCLCTYTLKAAALRDQADCEKQPPSVGHLSIAQGACRLQLGLQAFQSHSAQQLLRQPHASLSTPSAVSSGVRSQLASDERPAADAAWGPCRVHMGPRPVRPDAASPGRSANHSPGQVGTAAAVPGEQGGLTLSAWASPDYPVATAWGCKAEIPSRHHF